ncbi:MAG: metallophosphoesterase, partial [Tissierellia bacterium]|nr:metallophosphoesterase [Tissierellia bacterium]
MIKIQIIYKVIIIISIVILFFIAFYNGLVVRKYSLKTNKILKDQSIRIVLITDLHSQKYGEKQDKIREKIEAENPDIIALAGDIVDDSGRIEGVKLFIEAIKDIAPIYYVTGNHEIRTGEVDKIKGLFRSLGVNVLENSLQKVNVRGVDLIVAGVDDPNIVGYKSPGSNWYKEVYTSFSNMKDMGGYKILLSHRPEKVD